MPVDQDRYRSLIARAAFNAEFFRGTISDLSSAQRAMTFVGSPTWGRLNGFPILKKNAAADGTTSAAVAPVLDVTGSITFEGLFVADDVFMPVMFRQVGGTGGVSFGNLSGVNRGEVYLLDAAGAGARFVMTAIGALPAHRPRHLIISSIDGGTSGLVWINGVPSTCTLALAGVAASPPVSVVTTLGAVSAAGQAMISRCWPFLFTNEDAVCIAEQAKLLVGGW